MILLMNLVKQAHIAYKMVVLIAIVDYLLLVMLGTFNNLRLILNCFSFKKFYHDFNYSNIVLVRLVRGIALRTLILGMWAKIALLTNGVIAL